MKSSSEMCDHDVFRNDVKGARLLEFVLLVVEYMILKTEKLAISAGKRPWTSQLTARITLTRSNVPSNTVSHEQVWGESRRSSVFGELELSWCRGICNCSICMKKRGDKPTGVLVEMEKACGFSSVSDLLHVKGAHDVGHYKNAKQIGGSPRKQPAPEEGSMITSPKKLGKENTFDGKTCSNAIPPVLPPVKEKPNKKKRKGLKVLQDINVVNGASPNKTSIFENERSLALVKESTFLSY